MVSLCRSIPTTRSSMACSRRCSQRPPSRRTRTRCGRLHVRSRDCRTARPITSRRPTRCSGKFSPCRPRSAAMWHRPHGRACVPPSRSGRGCIGSWRLFPTKRSRPCATSPPRRRRTSNARTPRFVRWRCRPSYPREESISTR